MAHLPPDAAIFSPSVARQAASTARDWSYVDNWLAAKYNGRSPPPFERNQDTLRVLLALAGLNESADENRAKLGRVEAGALEDLHQHEEDDDTTANCLASFRRDFFDALESQLTRDGIASLDAIATAAVQLCTAFPEPAQLNRSMLDLQTRAFDLEQAAARVGVLQRYIDEETTRIEALLEEVGGDAHQPPQDMARGNLEMQRLVRAVSTKQLPELRDKVASLARVAGVPRPTVEDLRKEETAYLELLQVKRRLDQQIAEFEGLPPDTEQARRELDALRRQLRSITDHRDAVFENLVELETPRYAK